MERHFDCLIVGAGIIGLAHALAAARHGLRTAIIDRDAQAVGASVRDHADIVPGAIEAIEALRARGMRIAGTTGYTRPIMDVLEPLAAASGYRPELTVCAGDLQAGRPSPLMMWYAMAKLGVWPAACVVKVDDTAPGIGEGKAAGTWTVGIALTGNAVGLSAAELAVLPIEERARLREQAAIALGDADMVIDSIADLPQAVAAIDARLAAGERP